MFCTLIACEDNKTDETMLESTTEYVNSETEQTDLTGNEEPTETEDTTTSKERNTDLWSNVY